MKNPSRKVNWLVITILVIVVIAISAPIYFYRIMNATDNDYGSHIVYTYALLAKEPWPLINQSHPLLQILLAGMVWISRSRIDPFTGMIILLVACQVALTLILYFWFGKIKHKGWDWLRALVAASLTSIAPIMALAPIDNKFYFGYIGLADYHNPTMLLLRPLALISFIFAFRIFEKLRNPVWMMAVSALLVILSALAKPNYLLCILPAILVLGVIWTIRKKGWDWRLFLFGFAIPGVAVLIVQWWLAYSASASTGIMFNPSIETHFSGYLVWKFLLSILFPLIATGLLFRMITKEPSVLVAWIGFAAGTGMLYLLTESGNEKYSGNFGWGAEVMLLLLFASIARYCLRSFAGENPVLWKRLVIWGAFLLHLAAGVVYYIHCITGNPYI
jgi:hypothetical protein